MYITKTILYTYTFNNITQKRCTNIYQCYILLKHTHIISLIVTLCVHGNSSYHYIYTYVKQNKIKMCVCNIGDVNCFHINNSDNINLYSPYYKESNVQYFGVLFLGNVQILKNQIYCHGNFKLEQIKI